MKIYPSQFGASIKRECIEVFRKNKITLYSVILIGILITNFIFQSFSIFVLYTQPTGIIVNGVSWYSSVVQANAFIANIFLLVSMYSIMYSLNGEMIRRENIQPFACGLKPINYIIPKYVVQVGVPALLAGMVSLLNVWISIMVFENISVPTAYGLMIDITIQKLILSSFCVFVTVLMFLTIQFSLATITKQSKLAFLVTTFALVMGEPLVTNANKASMFSDTVYSYAITMLRTSGRSEFVLMSVVTTCIIMLLFLAAVLVFKDRFEID